MPKWIFILINNLLPNINTGRESRSTGCWLPQKLFLNYLLILLHYIFAFIFNISTFILYIYPYTHTYTHTKCHWSLCLSLSTINFFLIFFIINLQCHHVNAFYMRKKNISAEIYWKLRWLRTYTTLHITSIEHWLHEIMVERYKYCALKLPTREKRSFVIVARSKADGNRVCWKLNVLD